MKMKMKVRKKASYKPNMPIGGIDNPSRDRINQSMRQVNANETGKQIKADSALVTSWFKPSKYLGFKSNFK